MVFTENQNYTDSRRNQIVESSMWIIIHVRHCDKLVLPSCSVVCCPGQEVQDVAKSLSL